MWSGKTHLTYRLQLSKRLTAALKLQVSGSNQTQILDRPRKRIVERIATWWHRRKGLHALRSYSVHARRPKSSKVPPLSTIFLSTDCWRLGEHNGEVPPSACLVLFLSSKHLLSATLKGWRRMQMLLSVHRLSHYQTNLPNLWAVGNGEQNLRE